MRKTGTRVLLQDEHKPHGVSICPEVVVVPYR